MKRTNFHILLFAISLFVFLWSLWRRPVHVDDAWIAEYAYWYNLLGYVKSEAMRGFLGAENKLFIYHKFFVAEGAAMIRLFGFNIYALKTLSLIFGILSIFPLRILYRKYSADKGSFWLLLAIYLSFFHVMNLFFVYRPESQLVFLGLVSFVYLDRYLDSFKKSDLVISALLTAIAIGTHLNGVIYTGAAVLLLWIHRQWKAGFYYGVLGALGLVCYVIFDVRSIAEFHQMVNQFVSWRDVATANYGWTLLTRIISEQGRFLHSPPEIIYSVVLVFLLFVGRTAVKVLGRRILTYSALLTFCLAEIAHGSNTNYLIYAFPFFVLLLVFSYEYLSLKSFKHLVSAWVLVLIFICGNLVYDLSKFRDREHISPEYQKITEALPTDVYVLAPGPFVMQGLGRQKIQILVTYRDKVENGIIEASPEGIFGEAAKFGIEYIIFGRDDLKYFKITENKYRLYELMPVQPSTMFEIFQRRKNRDGKDLLSRAEIFFSDF